jgi:hypothetical protein
LAIDDDDVRLDLPDEDYEEEEGRAVLRQVSSPRLAVEVSGSVPLNAAIFRL